MSELIAKPLIVDGGVVGVRGPRKSTARRVELHEPIGKLAPMLPPSMIA
jgi:hypothetical protein